MVLGVVSELERLGRMSRDDAIWFVIKYTWKSNISFGDISAADLSRHTIRIMKKLNTRNIDPLSPDEYRRLTVGVRKPY